MHKAAPRTRERPKTIPKKTIVWGGASLVHGGKRYDVKKLLRLLPEYDPFAFTSGRWYFDTKTAQRALDFFAECQTFIEGSDVAGKPFILEPWQMAIVCNLFGWKDRKTHLRRYKRLFLYVPRKNGKTPLAAAILNYVAFLDNEPGAQIYTAAADKDQAALIFRHASQMASRDPILKKRCRVYRAYKSMEIPQTASFVRVLASDAHNKHGQNAHLVVIDELHAHTDDGELAHVLITSTASRMQPLVIFTTTADYLRDSECNREYDRACLARKGEMGVAGERYLPVIYEAPLGADWTIPETWEIANPNLDVSVRREYLEEEVEKAKLNHLLQNTFQRLHLNIRTEVAEKAFNVDHWLKCRWQTPQLQTPADWRRHWISYLRKEECYAGVDLSSTDDLTALVLYFPRHNVVLPWFWCPTERLALREKKNQFAKYLTWHREGFLEATPGNFVDQDYVFEQIKLVFRDYQVRKIAFDRWGADWIYGAMTKRGMKAERYGQGYREMTPPFNEITLQIAAGDFNHGGNPVLTWMVRNAAVQRDNFGNVRISKPESADKIDGVAGMMMAIGAAMTDEEPGNSRHLFRSMADEFDLDTNKVSEIISETAAHPMAGRFSDDFDDED